MVFSSTTDVTIVVGGRCTIKIFMDELSKS